MVKKIIYLVVLIILSLCVIENVRVVILDNVFFPIMNSIAKDSINYNLKINCGQIKLYVRDYDAAEKIFIEVIQQASTLTNKNEKYKAFYELGNVYYETERYDEAVRAYEIVLNDDIKNRRALKKYARIKMAMKDYVSVFRYVNAYVKKKPRDAFGHSERCAVLTRLGKYSAARASCEKAIESRKGYARAHYDYAVLLKVQGFNDLAEKEYKEAVRHSRHIKSRGELEKALGIKPKEEQLF